MYDLPALVEHVCRETGYDKVSQPHSTSLPSTIPLELWLPYLLPSCRYRSLLSPEHLPRVSIADPQIAFIGHSQGNGLAFISLSLGMCPNLGKKLSVFIALAPAVYAGPLTTGFPFTALNRLEWSTWKRLFGVLDFIPLMRWSYDYAPAKLFVSAA